MTSLTVSEQTRYEELNKAFSKPSCLSALSASAASFLIVGALIVITCASLCLALPGVNALSDVVLPVYLPCAGALILSIPFIMAAINHAKEKKAIREDLVSFITSKIETYNVESRSEKVAAKFIEENFLPEGTTKEYRSNLVSELKKKYGEQGTMADIFDKVTAHINQPKETSD